MIHYRPPKSSIWGHRMGHRSPAAFCSGLLEFLGDTARHYATERCWIMYAPGTTFGAGFDPLLESLRSHIPVPTDVGTRPGRTGISEEMFEACLTWLIGHEALFPAREAQNAHGSLFDLGRRRVLRGWKFPGPRDMDAAEVNSELEEAYGSIQRLGTALTFHSIDEYQWVKAHAKRCLDIRMHDRNVRPKGLL